MKLSASQIRYLLVIFDLSGSGNIRSNDIAIKMKVTRPSVHRMLSQLAKMKLIIKEKYSFVVLTKSGVEAAETYSGHFNRISEYFIRNIHISEDTAKESAIALLGELNEAKVLELHTMISRLTAKA